jgi:uncharacterized membrane protein YciS (DUF1049 family)
MTTEQLEKKIREMEREYDMRLDQFEVMISSNTRKLDNILSIVKGIAIGLALGAVIFGFLTIKDLISIAK